MKRKLIILLFLLPLYTMAQEELTYIVTVYNAVPSQCYGNHLKTADGSLIDTAALNNGTLRWCAVSRDMLNDGYKYGDKIEILHADESIAGIYEIHDTMSKKFTRHIDILMPENIKTGKWIGVKVKRVSETEHPKTLLMPK